MYNIIMIEFCLQKEKNLSGIDTQEPEITSNPETRDYKSEKINLPMYGIVSLILVLIGALVVLINFNNISISIATPFLLVSVITAGEGINADIVRGTAILGIILGGAFLVISLSPVFQYIAAIIVF